MRGKILKSCPDFVQRIEMPIKHEENIHRKVVKIFFFEKQLYNETLKLVRLIK